MRLPHIHRDNRRLPGRAYGDRQQFEPRLWEGKPAPHRRDNRFVNGDTSSVVSGAAKLTTTATLSSPVGTYPITIATGTLSAVNYTFTLVNGTLTIEKAKPIILWPAPAAITYGTVLSAEQLDASARVRGRFAYTPELGARLTAGTHKLSVVFTPANTTDYEAAKDSVELVVDKKTLTVTADNVSVVFDQPIPRLKKYTVKGFAHGEDSSVLSGSPLEVTTAKKGSPVGDYPIEISRGTLSAVNYTFTFKNGTLTITPEKPTATPRLEAPAAAYVSPPKVTVTDATPSAVMYYSLDGAAPAASLTKYTGPIAPTMETKSIEVIALTPNYTVSAIASAAYTAN